MLIKLDNLCVYLYLLFVFSPVFIYFNDGLRIYSELSYEITSLIGFIPISAFFIFGGVLVYRNKFDIKDYLLISILLLLFAISYFISGVSRVVFIVAGLLFFAASFRVGACVFNSPSRINIFKYVVYSAVLLKFAVDVIFYRELYSQYFVFDFIAIRNYYEYYLVFYTICFGLALDSLKINRVISIDLFVLVLSSCIIFSSYSDIAKLVIFIVVLSTIFYRLSLLSSGVWFLSYILFNLALVFLVVLNIEYFTSLNASAYVRFGHWYNFLSTLDLADIFFPVLNDYRGHLDGSLHNEMLEIYSLLGVIGIFSYIFMLLRIQPKRVSSLYLSVIGSVLIGGIVQLNLVHIYSGILLGMTSAYILAVDKHRPENIKAFS